MRITTRQLRHIIREEASRALSEAGEVPQADLLQSVRNIGTNLQAIAGRRKGALGALAGVGRDPSTELKELADDVAKQLDALQRVAKALETEAWKSSGKQKIAAAKAAQQAKETRS